MAKSNFGEILLLDNDVMVNLFDLQYSVDRATVEAAVEYLQLRFSRIWIPQTVRNEFLRKTGDKRRARRLGRVLRKFPIIKSCPIPVGKTEIATLIGITEEDAGEADALLQAQKAKAASTYHFKDIVFLSNDRGAHQMAQELSVTTLKYKDFQAQLREAGIVLIS